MEERVEKLEKELAEIKVQLLDAFKQIESLKGFSSTSGVYIEGLSEYDQEYIKSGIDKGGN